MYAIKSGGKVVGYSDTVVYVRLTEIGYIKGGIDRIERKQDAQDARYIGMAERMSAVESSAKSAHHRIDRLEGREVREDG